jgi:hypothetical protein
MKIKGKIKINRKNIWKCILHVQEGIGPIILPGNQILTVLGQSCAISVVVGKMQYSRSTMRDFFSKSTLVVFSSSLLILARLSVNQSSKPVILHHPSFPDTSHLYLFEKSNMSQSGSKKTTPVPVKNNDVSRGEVPFLVVDALKKVKESFDARAGGSIADDEDYIYWGKEFIGHVVRHWSSLMSFY